MAVEMRITAVFLLVPLAMLGQAVFVQAQTGQFPTFPYCLCQQIPSAYRVDSMVTFKSNGTYCFTVRVNIPAGCNSYCCSQADLRKIEINARKACDVSGIVLSATLNGVSTSVNPNIETAPQGPTDATILKVTQLGLNLTQAEGAEICITLKTNRGGRGCRTLEELCDPPPGSAIGVCTVALFSSNTDCCPTSVVNPPPPPPPPSPPPPPPPPPCETCVSFSLTPPVNTVSYQFVQQQCNAYSRIVAANLSAAAARANATILRPFTLRVCNGDLVKVCGSFASEEDSQRLQPVASNLAQSFLTLVTTSATCPPYLLGHSATVRIDGDASGRPCLNGAANVSCAPVPVEFPRVSCDATKGSAPFSISPFYTTRPGRRVRIRDTKEYCFNVTVVQPTSGACGITTGLSKVEIWANENLRTSINGFALSQPTASNATFIYANWGPIGASGNETVKATPLDWSLAASNGAEICLELDNPVTLDDVCLGPFQDTCFIAIFDQSRKCCPMFTLSGAPYIP